MKNILPLSLVALLGFSYPAQGKVWISEFVADNDGSHVDENDDAEDWIELFNDGEGAVDLGGWSLTDDAAEPRKWVFPPGASIAAKGYLVVFASKKNRRIAGSEYHTNFSLSKSGEYLALIRVDGTTVEDDFGGSFPGQFEGVSYGIGQGGGGSLIGYHTEITPGGPNGDSLAEVGPIIRSVTDKPERPVGGTGSAPLLVTAEIQEGSRPVSQVRLFYKVMFGAELQILMTDDGSGADETAGDGVYSANVPTTSLAPGEMIRWRVEAFDLGGGIRLSPPYLDPRDADRYYGTVSLNPDHGASQLPILETFVQNQVAVDTVSGTTASMYYLGEFYDNLQMDRHGQSTGAFPKKSYDVDFNKGNRFRWKEGEERVKDINLLTNWADKSKVRNSMAYEFLQRCGSPYHYAFPVRMDRNGEFFSITDMVEDGDDRFLDRVGLDREGTLYKMYDKLEVASRASKKTRKNESNSDLASLISNLNTSNSLINRRRYAYDNINLAATVNHLAAYVVVGISDTGHKNYYMYRDTEGDEEWQPLPWDVDLSAGRRWNRTDRYFDDTFFSNLWINSPNRLWSLIHNTPEYRHMILRRIRTLREQVLLSNSDAGNGPDWYSDRVNELVEMMDPSGAASDADQDYAKWGSWGNNNRIRPAAQRIIDEWLPGKRTYMFSSARSQGGVRIPGAQPEVPDLEIQELEYLPSSGNQEEEYIVIKNKETSAMDLSGFTLSGAIEYTFPPGTVVNSGAGDTSSQYQGVIHVVKDAQSFRARASGPSGNEFRYIQGDYSGQFSARGEMVELRNPAGDLVDSFTYEGNPTVAQESLRVTEVNYHPADPTPAEEAALPGVTAEDFEFVEFINTSITTLNLAGVQVTEGVAYTFPVNAALPSNTRIIIAKNPAAFAIRYPGYGGIAYGPYSGQLNNDGDTIRVVDAVGENILVFTYNDVWYSETDGAGKSLVLNDETFPYDGLDLAAAWIASEQTNGTPGLGDGPITNTFTMWQNQRFNPVLHNSVGSAMADPDRDGRPNWKEYALGTNPFVKDGELFLAEVVTDEGQTYLGARTRRVINGTDLVWSFEVGNDLDGWASVDPVTASSIQNGDGTETVILREATPAGDSPLRFLRFRLSFQP
ncbi:MAG: lamin tail domain-containing protein [Akkermansiaceae bacterium]